jgi:hypothetical protein
MRIGSRANSESRPSLCDRRNRGKPLRADCEGPLGFPLTCAFRVSTIAFRGINHFVFAQQFTFKGRSL